MRSTLILVLLQGILKAQPADSLFLSIVDLQSDTEKVNRLYFHGYSIRNQDPQQAAAYAEECLTIAENAGSDRHLAKACHLQGIVLYKKGQLQQSLRFHQRALDLRKRNNDVLGIAMSHNNIGNVLADLDQPANAEQAYLSAVHHYLKCGDHKRMAGTLVNIGGIRHQQKQFGAAYQNYTAALQIADEHNDHETRSLCLNNIAQLLFERGDYEGSLALNFDALELRQLMDSELEVTDSYLNLATNYLKLNDTMQAKQFADSAYHQSVRLEYFEGQQAAARLYSDYYSITGNYKLAWQWLKEYEGQRERAIYNELSPNEKTNSEGKREGTPAAAVNNMWLLFTLGFFGLTMPFVMIRYKR